MKNLALVNLHDHQSKSRRYRLRQQMTIQNALATFILVFLVCNNNSASAQATATYIGGPMMDFRMSYDGSTVAGVFYGPFDGNGNVPFRWTSSTGLQYLDVPYDSYNEVYYIGANGNAVVGISYLFGVLRKTIRWENGVGRDVGNIYPGGINFDASFIVGSSKSEQGNTTVASMWSQGSGIQILGSLNLNANSHANLSSDDGSVVTGYSQDSSGTQSFRWTNENGIQGMGSLSGYVEYPRFISADGNVIVGQGIRANGDPYGFRWTTELRMEDLGSLGGTWTYPQWMSRDGTMVIGKTAIFDDYVRPFVWTASNGMSQLGHVVGWNLDIVGASADGEIVVGNYQDDNGKWHIFTWTKQHSNIDLNAYLVSCGALRPGHGLESLHGISADGNSIIGRKTGPDQEPEGYYITNLNLRDTLPPTSTFTPTPSATWSNSDVTATITSTDNVGGSGVKEIHYSINMGAEQVITGSTASFTLSDNGTHSIAYYAIDNLGNTKTTNYATVRIDKTRPTVDAYAIGSLVTVIAQDTFSGVASTKVSIDGAAAIDYTGSFTVAPGAHTVTYWATDQAGNESTREVILVGVTVSSVTMAPTNLFATKAALGTVKLSLPAPAGGVVVMLESNSQAVSVPMSVTVPAGSVSASFIVTANTVSTDTKAVISASVGGQEVHGTVYVLVPFPKTLTVSPTTIIGGDAGIGTVALASNAGVGGQVVNLTSSNVNVVVPATVTVPAGATSATFPVNTSIISSDISVAISADAVGSGITTTVLIKRVAPKSITFAPASVVGGNSSVATLTVTKPAPAGGIVIDLRSVSSNVSVPATVTIAAGATTATFPVTTVPVKKSESAMIQAYAAGVKVSANVTVTATSVVSVSLNPATVVGGLNSTGTITLNGNAPTGGTTVQLYSTNVIAGVPESVVVPAGSKTVTFPVTTVAVAANTTASIAAKYLGTTKSAALTIAAPTVSTLTLAPSSLTGGGTSKLTIKLSGKAAIGGVVVALTSSNTVIAQLPASVTIPAGSDTIDVTIQTGVVAVTTNVTITAKTGAVAKTAVLTVNK